MFKNQLLVSSSRPSEASSSTDEVITILSEFEVEDSYYQVISLGMADPIEEDSPREASTLLTVLLNKMGIEQFVEIERFTAKGKSCIIIETPSANEQAATPLSTISTISSVLTERELEIAALVAIGKVNKQIAKQLHISEWTVATYLRRMFAKLSVNSRAALVYRCAPLIQHFHNLSTTASEI